MNPTPIRLVTVGPVFLFGTAILWFGVAGWSPVSILVAVVLALPLLAAARPAWLGWLIAPSIVLFLLDGALTWAVPGLPTGGAAEFIAGVFLGLPLWFLGLALGSPDRPGMSLLALTAGLFEIVTTGTALASLPTTPVPSAAQFLAAWFTVDGHQLAALGSALANGGLGQASAFPLSGYADPVFVALAFLALGGTLLPLLGTEDAPVAPTPKPSRRDLAPSVRRRPPPVLYATAEAATPLHAPRGAGLVPVGGAVLAVATLELVAAASPAYTFTIVTAIVVVTLVALVRLARPRRVATATRAARGPAPSAPKAPLARGP